MIDLTRYKRELTENSAAEAFYDDLPLYAPKTRYPTCPVFTEMHSEGFDPDDHDEAYLERVKAHHDQEEDDPDGKNLLLSRVTYRKIKDAENGEYRPYYIKTQWIRCATCGTVYTNCPEQDSSTEEYKQTVVKRALSGEKITRIVKEFEISDQTVRQYMDEYLEKYDSLKLINDRRDHILIRTVERRSTAKNSSRDAVYMVLDGTSKTRLLDLCDSLESLKEVLDQFREITDFTLQSLDPELINFLKVNYEYARINIDTNCLIREIIEAGSEDFSEFVKGSRHLVREAVDLFRETIQLNVKIRAGQIKNEKIAERIRDNRSTLRINYPEANRVYMDCQSFLNAIFEKDIKRRTEGLQAWCGKDVPDCPELAARKELCRKVIDKIIDGTRERFAPIDGESLKAIDHTAEKIRKRNRRKSFRYLRGEILYAKTTLQELEVDHEDALKNGIVRKSYSVNLETLEPENLL